MNAEVKYRYLHNHRKVLMRVGSIFMCLTYQNQRALRLLLRFVLLVHSFGIQ